MKSCTFRHPIAPVYIASTMEAAKTSAYLKEIEDQINYIENDSSVRTPLIGKTIIIIKDRTGMTDQDIVKTIEKWYAKELNEGKEGYAELIEYIKIWLPGVKP